MTEMIKLTKEEKTKAKEQMEFYNHLFTNPEAMKTMVMRGKIRRLQKKYAEESFKKSISKVRSV